MPAVDVPYKVEGVLDLDPHGKNNEFVNPTPMAKTLAFSKPDPHGKNIRSVVGVDYSTSAIHYAIVENGNLVALYSREPESQFRDFEKRLHSFRKEPLLNLEWKLEGTSAAIRGWHLYKQDFFNTEWCVVEGYMARFDTAGKMAAVHWLIRTEAVENDQKIHVVPATSWKKQVGLTSHAQKPDVKQRMCDMFSALPKNLTQDCYDAAAIAVAGYRTVYLEGD